MLVHEAQKAVSDFLDIVMDHGVLVSFKREEGIVTTWSKDLGWIDFDLSGNRLRRENTACNTTRDTHPLEEQK